MKFYVIAVGELKPDLQSRLIQMGIMAPYSHIAIMVVHENGKIEIFESIGKGIVRSELDEVLDNGGAVIREQYELHELSVSEERAYGWLESKLGGWYSLIQYLGFMGRLFSFFGPIGALFRRWKLVANGPAFSVCSELGARFVLYATTINNPRLDDPDFVNPRDLCEVLHAASITGRCKRV